MQAQQTDTWNGGGTDNFWGTAANWGGTAPNVAGDNLIFSGSARPSNTNNLVTSVGWIKLNPSTAMTFSGSALTNNLGFTNVTQNNTWNIPTTLGGNVNFNVASGLTLTMAGVVSGGVGSSLMQTGPGTLVLNNITNNTFTSPVVVSSGSTLQLSTLTANQNYNFPSSSISLNSATLYFNGSSGGTALHTYNFPNLTGPIASTNSTVKFTSSNTTTKALNAALDFEGVNTILYTSGSFTHTINFNGKIIGNGTLTFNYTGSPSTRNVNFNTNGNNYSGTITFNAVSLGTGGNTINLKYPLGTPAYVLSTNWTMLVSTNALDTATAVSLVGTNVNLKWSQSQFGWSNSAAALAVNAGTVTFGNTGPTNGNISIGNLSGTGFGGVITNAGTNITLFTVNQTSDATFAGTIADNSVALLTLVKNGASTLTLAGTNTYAGSTTINAGGVQVNGALASPTVTVNSGGSLGGIGSVTGATTINDGGAIYQTGSSPLTLNTLTLGASPTDNLTLTLTGDGTTIPSYVAVTGALANNGKVTVNVIGALPTTVNATYTLMTYPGTVSGTGTFVVGALTSGVLGYITNNTAASAIQLVVTGSDYLLWKGSPANNWDLSGANNWILGSSGLPTGYQNGELVTFDDTAANFTVNLAASVTPGGIVVSNANNYTLNGSGKITGTTTLTKSGTGTLTLTTTNNFSSPTTISGGTVQLGDGTANNGSVSSSIVDNGALVFANPGNQTYAGSVSGSGTVTKQAAGALTVSGNNIYDGATTISGGTFIAGSTNALGSTVGATTVSGGTLDVNGQNLGTESVNISGTGLGGNGAVINNGAVQLNALQNLALNSAATIGGSNRWDVRANGAGANLNLNGATLTKIGTNDIALVSVTVSDGNIVVNQGRFGLQLGTIFPAGLGQITVNPAGTLWVGDFGTPLQVSQPIVLNGGLIQADSGTTATLGSPIMLATNSAIYASVPITLSQPISGTGLLTKTGTSTLILDNPTNTWTGGLIIAAGTLQLGNNDNNGSLPPTIAVVTNNGVLAYSQTTDFTFTQPMVGTGGLGQYGPNTITITNQQSYTGSTVLQNGTLRLAAGNNTLSNATGLSFTGGSTLDMGTNSQTVSGLTLSGNGTANVLSSGTLNVSGASPAQLGSTGATAPVLNLTALNSFSYNGPLNEFSVGAPATGLAGQPAAANGSGTVNFALTNTITAGQFGVADQGGYPGYTSTGIASLGQVNTINADTVAVGYANTGYIPTGTLNYQSSVASPSLVLRNAAGTGRANVYLGYESGSSYTIIAKGIVDLYTVGSGASTLDALVGTMVLGQHNLVTANQAFAITGQFAMGLGILDATSIILGQKTYSGGLTGSSVLGQFVLLGGTVKVKTMLLGDQQFTNGPTVTGEFDFTSGTLQAGTINAGVGNATRTFNWTSGTIQNYDASTDLAINGLNLTLGSGPLAFNIGTGRLGTIASSLNGNTPITQTGSGTLVLSGNNSGYSGALANQAGAIYINGPLSGSVEAFASTTVGGSNSVTSVQVDNGATVQAGDLTGAGTLTANTLSLGVASTDLTQSRFNLAAGGLITANSLTVNGTNIVNLTGAPVPVGTNNLILYSGSIGGNGINGFKLGSLPGAMTGYLQNNPGVAVQLVVTSSVNTTPPTLTATVSGNTLNLSWPADHLGWRLLAQTNSLSTGLGTNWVTVPGSMGTTSQSLTIDPAAPTVFFRLVYP